MIQKYFSISVVLTSITVVSCRQDSEINTVKEEINMSQEDITEGGMMSKDTLQNSLDPNDPPKNGTHYRIKDSIIIYADTTNPPKNGTHYKGKDSLNYIDDNTNPPKNGTHYKSK